MKKTAAILGVTLCLVVLATGAALADYQPEYNDLPDGGRDAESIRLRDYRVDDLTKLDIGTEIFYFNYKEPGVMEEDGPMYGIFADYTFRTQENAPVRSWSDLFSPASNLNMYRLEGRVAWGQVDYTSNGTGSVNDIDEWMAELRFTAGYDFPIRSATLTPYVGVGYRYLHDGLGGHISTSGAFGYDRDSQYIYLPIGMELSQPLENEWTLAFLLEYDLFLDGTQKSHLEDVSSSLNTLENDQDKGYGARGAIQLRKDQDTYGYLMEVFGRYWNIDQSNTSTVTCGGTPCALGYEPDNESFEVGMRLGLSF